MASPKGKVAFGALLAAGAGLVAGLLTAPKSGKQTRNDIKHKAKKLKGDAETTADSAKAEVNNRSQDLKSRTENAVKGAKKGFARKPVVKKDDK